MRPRLWNPETPNLYQLVLAVMDEGGTVIEAESCMVGFREVELKDGKLLEVPDFGDPPAS